jgi:hypothetical protein
MIAREYLALQAATLLKLAKVTSSPSAAAALTNKAAELQARSGEAPLSDPPDLKIK